MKNLSFTLAFIACTFFLINGQDATIDLSFQADNNGQSMSVDSILIKNLTQGEEIMLYAPDTSLTITYVGIDEKIFNPKEKFDLSVNFPNPFKEQTYFILNMAKSGSVEIVVFNILGKRLLESSRFIESGQNRFVFIPGNEDLYFLSVSAFGFTKTIRMINMESKAGECEIFYHGNTPNNFSFKSVDNNKEFPFMPGDFLLFVAYNLLGESGFIDTPEESTSYTFQFATNTPCIGAPTVDYEGQIYNTIQVFGQCWFKENLNVGTMINSSQFQLDNNVIEKYCLLDDAGYCDSYGGVYMWDELMQYSTEESSQGICPPGWHVPSDADWKALEGAVDSQYGIGNSVWDLTFERGYDAGLNLKSTNGWYSGGNGLDLFGFTAISGGFYYNGGGWAGGELFGPFYTSSHMEIGTITKPFHRGLSWMWNQISREYDFKENARPIRCLKDIN